MKPQFYIDSPERHAGAVYSPVLVAGWFFDNARHPAVEVRVRLGTEVFVCDRVKRPDVAAQFSLPQADGDRIGFRARLPDFDGRMFLVIEAVTAAGETILLRRHMVRVNIWPPRQSGLLGWLNRRRQKKDWTTPPGEADSVLVLIPVKRGTAPEIVAHARALAERALGQLPAGVRSRVVFDDRGSAISRKDHAWRVAALAEIRQGMIDSHLDDERWVFWPDIDLVNYSPDLLADLIRRSGGGIAAPMVFMENAVSHIGGPLFYDVAGFVEKGRWASPQPPYFEQKGPVYELESVGSCYLVPAELYRKGARHVEDSGSRRWIESRGASPDATPLRDWKDQAYTEHHSVCAFALKQGLPVRAFADLIAVHEHVS